MNEEKGPGDYDLKCGAMEPAVWNRLYRAGDTAMY